MSGFSIRNPFFIIVCCLIVAIVGTVTLVRMPVDLFPPINIPVVVVATFYSGMPPQQIETNITNPFERFFTLASGVDHIESRSLPGVSLIKIYFQAGTNADADLSTISNLAMADLRRLPPGTLPPVVLKFDASSLPVCLITLKGQGLNETELHDLGQYNVRNQIANVPGASVPQTFGGRHRQIMVYVDPLKPVATSAGKHKFSCNTTPASDGARCTANGNFSHATAGRSAGVEKKSANHGGKVACAGSRAVRARTESGAITHGVFESNGRHCKRRSAHFGWSAEQSDHLSARGNRSHSQPADHRLRTY